MSKRLTVKVTTIAAGLITIAALTGCGESAVAGSDQPPAGKDPDTLVIGHIPSEDSTDLDESFATVAEVIEKQTGKKVQFQTSTSYAAVIEAQRAGKVQIASYGPFSYVVAKDSGVKVDLVGYPAETKDDAGGYRSVASVAKGSAIKSLADLKGKKVCFVDPTSTSGYLFPSAGLLKAGLDPKTDVKPIFAGGHDSSVLAVASGQCDAAFSTEDMAKRQLIESGQLKKRALTQIWNSDTIPPSPMAVSSTLSSDLKAKLTTIFNDQLNIDWLKKNGYCGDAAKTCGLPAEASTMWGYKPIEDSAYDGIRKVCTVTKSDSCQAEG